MGGRGCLFLFLRGEFFEGGMDFGRVRQGQTGRTVFLGALLLHAKGMSVQERGIQTGRTGLFLGWLLLHAKGMSVQERGLQMGRTGRTVSDRSDGADGVEGGGKDGSEPFDVFEPEEHSDCQTEGDQDYEGKGVGKAVEAYVDIHSVEAGYKRGDHEAY